MAIKGHKERALLRRGIYVQESLKRRPNVLNETALLRRTITEDITPENEKHFKDMVKLSSLCGDDINQGISEENSVYCKLVRLLSGMQQRKALEIHKAIDDIYRFYRERITTDNRTLFRKTAEVILKNENPSIAFKLIATYLQDPDININEKVARLRSFIQKNGEIREAELEDFLRAARAIEYSKYEESFAGNHFDLIRGYIELKHGHDESSFHKIISGILTKKYDINESIKIITDTILNTSRTDLIGKADLSLKSALIDTNENIILDKGSKVEVKKMDYRLDSYFSEFFAIYKNPKNFPEYINDPVFILVYNRVIDGVYLQLKERGEGLLETIGNSIDAIVYEKNRIILMDDIELYWSNKGQRGCDDHRLTIRYRLNKPNVVSYIYTNNNPVLEIAPVTIEVTPKLECPIVGRT